jgi:transposase
MFFAEASVKIWLYTQATDMRKSFDGLAALVKNKLLESPLSGQLFIFCNRRRTQLKLLYFDNSGYCIWMKRLEQGRFHFNDQAGDKIELSWVQLQMIINGIDTQKITQYKRYSHANRRAERYNPGHEKRCEIRSHSQ